MTEQHAQDANGLRVPEGEDRGVAYAVTYKIRRFFKRGSNQKPEMYMTMEMASMKDEDTQEVVVRLSVDMGGGIVISDDRYHEQWRISPYEIVSQYLEMRKNIKEEDK